MIQRLGMARLLLLLILPLLAAYGAYCWAAGRDMPLPPRVARPSVPAPYQNLTNPLRNAGDALAKYTEEGRVLYEKNCSHCHGVGGAGDGFMARAFRLRPANFHDPIRPLTDDYLFWRIKQGGAGLPPESTPWDSAMPAWGGALSDEEIWKIILGLTDVATLGPATSTDYSDAHLKKTKIADRPEMQKLGEAVYRKRCSFCHGDQGAGDGPLADYLFPRPRNLRRGLFKLRSTTELPTDEDLFRTLSLGIPGTSMPAWGKGERMLPERERWAVIYYFKTFHPDFKEAQAGAYKNLLVMDLRPTDSQSIRRHGAEIFLSESKGACLKCHGAKGRGDGREAGIHRDDFGFPILPANLTQRWRLKNWEQSVDGLYRAVSLGVQGTVMPSYLEAFDPQDRNQDRNDRWSLAYFTNSLGEEDTSGRALLRSRTVAGDLPLDPADARWYEAAVPVLGVPLSGQLMAKPRLLNPAVDYLTVRALHNQNAIAFLLAWDDRFKDVTHTEPPAPDTATMSDTYPKIDYDKLSSSYTRARDGRRDGLFRDAAAIQFPVRFREGQPPPYFFLGQPGAPVNLWWWKADWQEDAAAHGGTGVEALTTEGLAPWPISSANRPPAVQSRALYDNGRWSVVMTRSLRTEDLDHDVQFRAGVRLPIAFHIWEGANLEEGLRRSISSWFYLQLGPPATPSNYGYALAAFLLTVGLEFLLRRFWLTRRNASAF